MHHVAVSFELGPHVGPDERLALEDAVVRALRTEGAGRLDGDETGPDTWTLFLYGRNADVLFDAIRPVLKARRWSDGALVRKCYGGPCAEVRERRLWRGRFRVVQRARKPGKRPKVGDVVELQCATGLGFAQALFVCKKGPLRSCWIVRVFRGVRHHRPDPVTDFFGSAELCRVWTPLGSLAARGSAVVVGHFDPPPVDPDDVPLTIVNDVRLAECVVHGRSVYDDDYREGVWEDVE